MVKNFYIKNKTSFVHARKITRPKTEEKKKKIGATLSLSLSLYTSKARVCPF
jgi:hypothetical protein